MARIALAGWLLLAPVCAGCSSTKPARPQNVTVDPRDVYPDPCDDDWFTDAPILVGLLVLGAVGSYFAVRMGLDALSDASRDW